MRVMREERSLKLLSLIDILESLSEDELRKLARRCPDTFLQGGKDFYRPNEHDGGMFLIKEGRVRVYATTPAGKETTLELLGSGTVLWTRSLEAVHSMDVHVRAIEKSTVAFMNRDDLAELILREPEVGLRMMNLLAEWLGSTCERIAETAHKEVLSRLASQIWRLIEKEGVVERGGGYLLPSAYTHEALGAMIGARRVAVTCALRVLRAQGVVQMRQRLIYVKNLRDLQLIAAQER